MRYLTEGPKENDLRLGRCLGPKAPPFLPENLGVPQSVVLWVGLWSRLGTTITALVGISGESSHEAPRGGESQTFSASRPVHI